MTSLSEVVLIGNGSVVCECWGELLRVEGHEKLVEVLACVVGGVCCGTVLYKFVECFV